MIKIHRATENHVESVAALFDAYRVFYGQTSDLQAATSFLRQRIARDESLIFIAAENEKVAGFTQLYPVFSSISMERSYILNDLYVIPEMRGQGIGKLLLNYCQTWVKVGGYKGLALETAKDNPAQHLYEREGWIKDEDFIHYFWKRPGN